MPWRDNIIPPAPTNLIFNINGNNVELIWEKPITTDELQKPRQFVVYRSTNATVDINNANNIRVITNKDTTKYIDVNVVPGIYYYTITSLDRLYNESVVSNTATINLNATSISAVNAAIPVFKLLSSNPARGELHVQYNLKEALQVKLQLINANGEIIQSVPFSTRAIGVHNYKMKINDLPAGFYSLALMTKKGNKILKVVVE
jgi:hypothetical protein